MVSENRLSLQSLIQPIFIDERIKDPKAIESMPGQFRQSLLTIAEVAGKLEDLGVPAVLLLAFRSTRMSLAPRLTIPMAWSRRL